MIAFGNEAGEFECFEWPVDPFTRTVFPKPKELEKCRRLYEDPKIEKVFHHAKYDIRILEQAFGIHVRGKIHDTLFMAHACDSLEDSLELKALGVKYLSMPKSDQDDLLKLVRSCRREAKKLGWSLSIEWKSNLDGTLKPKAPPKGAGDYWMPKAFDKKNTLCREYCIGDVRRTMMLRALFEDLMDELEGARGTYEREMKLWPVTYAMETCGIHQSLKRGKEAVETCRPRAEEHLAQVRFAAHDLNFNPRSTDQVGKLMHETLELPVLRRTSTGKPQVDATALEEHGENEVVNDLLWYKSLDRTTTTCFLNYLHRAEHDPSGDGWLLHTDFNQIGPVTGRFSSRRPPLQNVANPETSRSKRVVSARVPFGPRKGCVWFSVDYEQLELMIFADVAQEETMLQAIADGEDLPAACANKAWGRKGNSAGYRAANRALEDHPEISAKFVDPVEWLSSFDYDICKAEASLGKKNSRALAKMILYAKIYGGGANAIKDILVCTPSEASFFLDEYDTAFPGIREYMNELSSKSARKGYLINRFGRRLSIDPRFAYRSVNYEVQSDAAELLKRAMLGCAEYLEDIEGGELLLCVHDELIFEFELKLLRKKHIRQLCRVMEDHGGAFQIPVKVSVERITESWDKKQKADIGEWRKAV